LAINAEAPPTTVFADFLQTSYKAFQSIL